MSEAPLRLRGWLRRSERGFLLEMDDGHRWRLTGVDDLSAFEDAAIIVEARRVNTGQLEVLWAGAAD